MWQSMWLWYVTAVLGLRLHMNAQEALGQRSHGQRRHRRRGRRVFAPLEAVDDDGPLLPRLFGRQDPVVPQSDSLQSHRTSRLHHVEFAPGRMHPHPEASEVPVPEQGILRGDGERIDGALGESQCASLQHGNPSSNHKRPASIRQALKRIFGEGARG